MRFSFSGYTAFKTGVLPLLLFLLLEGCANIVPPGGGPKDLTPPRLLSVKPSDSALNKRISKIELYFNKFMVVEDVQNNLQMSPLLTIPPTVLAYGKRVEIKIIDSLLKDNTTYQLSLGDALVDNREATPYKNFVYLFSTGSYFDSLKLHGRVFDAATGLPDSTATVLLYPEAAGDSAILRHQALYAKKVDASGYFSFSLLPQKSFRAYAVEDINGNHLYDFGTEKVDFSDHMAMPALDNDSFLVFHVFKEQIDTTVFEGAADTTAKDHESNASSRFKRNKPKNEMAYKVNVDTMDRSRRTFELTQPLIIDLNVPLSALDSSRVYLSYNDSGIDVQAVQKLIVDSTHIKVETKWLENTLYTLRLIKGWAKDTSGAELSPAKYFFRTKRADDYSTLKIHMDPAYVGNQYLLYVYREKDSVYQQPIKTPVINIPLLQPGTYGMRVIADENHNGKWDSGHLLKRRHAEQVIPYSGSIILKAGWENEVDFKKQAEDAKGAFKGQKDQFSNREKGSREQQKSEK